MSIKTILRVSTYLFIFLFGTTLVAQPAHVERRKAEQEAMKKRAEYEREARKADEEYYREMRKADEEYYREERKANQEYYREMRKAEEEYLREMRKADQEAYREYMKRRQEAIREGYPAPPPPGYYEEYPQYEGEYEYDDEPYDPEYRRPGQQRRRPTSADNDGVGIEGEVIIRGRRRIRIPNLRRSSGG